MSASSEWKMENLLGFLLSISSVYIAFNVVSFIASGELITYLSSGELSIFHGAIFTILLDLTFIAIFFVSFFALAYLRFKAILQDYIQQNTKRDFLSLMFLIFCITNCSFFLICIINVVSKI